MATIYMKICFRKQKTAIYWPILLKKIQTTVMVALQHRILQYCIDLFIHLVLKFGCHTSRRIDILLVEIQMNPPSALTHRHSANYHNAPLVSAVFKKVNMTITC